jgi:hypothetical protein
MSDRADAEDEWDDIEDDGVLDSSDTLDDDAVADPLDVGVQAADRWSGANRFGTTVAEARAGESLDQRLAEEEPDIDPDREPGQSNAARDDPDADEEDSDEDELTRRGYEQDPRAGRLVAEDEGFGEDEEADSVAFDRGIDSGAASAEEAAVHVMDDPDGPGDGPLR